MLAKKLSPPKGVEARYVGDIRRIAAELRNELLSSGVFFAVRSDAQGDEDDEDDEDNDGEVEAASKTRKVFSVLFAGILLAVTRVMNEILGPKHIEPDTFAIYQEHETQNVVLVEKLVQDFRQKMTSIAALPSLHTEQLNELVKEAVAESDRHAEMIARDQTLKLMARLNQGTAQANGVEEYVWSTEKDNLVRPMHVKLEGTTHTWDDPPIVNEQGDALPPGEDYNCRCVAIPKV